jgi:aspartate aminotransferase
MKSPNLKLSKTAENLIGSEIRKIAGAVNERIEKGEKIYNLTIGDFSPKVFPIPAEMKEEIIKAYNENLTNYPTGEGMLNLRKSVSEFIKDRGGFDYKPEEILIGSGARPLTYTIFKTIVDPGDVVIYPAPSWNNICYVQLSDAKGIAIETSSENNFVPTAADLKPYIKDAVLLALNSPLNPSGTLIKKEALKEIIDLVVEENKRRGENQKPLYIFYDMIYWILTFDGVKHYNPVDLNPEIRDYIIFVDGISKCFAATGVRLGWAFGPKAIICKMNTILAHIGAWSPKPEQVAVGRYLARKNDVDRFFTEFKNEIVTRLKIFYDEFKNLKSKGFNVDAISPQGAIYLTVKIDLSGLKTSDGNVLKTTEDITKYILEDAKMALVPFYAFGSPKESKWFRLSVGTCSMDDAKQAAISLRESLMRLNK